MSLSRLALVALLVLAPATPALADQRNFAYSYPYVTPEAGERELELYTDYGSTGTLKQQLEFALGLTDRTSVSVYGVFKNLNKFDAVKLQTRHRFAEAGEWPLDTGLYLEYEQPLDLSQAPVLEGKLLLEKRLGALVADSNLIAKKPLSAAATEYGATLGLGYALGESMIPGLELRYTGGAAYLGPTLAAGFGPVHLVGGALLGLNGGYQTRLILGTEF